MHQQSEPEYVSIGRFTGTYGIKGELVLHHGLGGAADTNRLKVIFVKEKSGHRIPWFVETARPKKEREMIIKLEGLNSKEEAGVLLRKEVWMTRDDFTACADNNTPIALLGYQMMDNRRPLGEIREVIEQPHQVLCRLEIQEKEVLVPLHSASLQRIDHKNKKVYVTLPEGLLDIYLSP